MCNRVIKVDWKKIIDELLERGLSEADIAARLRAEGVSISQASINRLKRGAIKRPNYDLGSALLRLHQGCEEDAA